jgi:hypothetical protein
MFPRSNREKAEMEWGSVNGIVISRRSNGPIIVDELDTPTMAGSMPMKNDLAHVLWRASAINDARLH